ncbi:Hsp33 protein [Plesiocystis pacifica SIR-1]|uniref:Hsp33 protein n=1 Tax=Plesiocystis pacifica SIR-1 TaxID=391625 RepID=A6GAA7_9BACT|nr:Hsp33 family molecular chaperone HslO [Plesiocystis pacifica]EDM77209.1 Hsp33 protein [Plesiocystis pacifica SIR-1]
MDALLRAINQPETIRIVAATTSDAVREACRRQRATGAEAIALGRAMTAGVLLATFAKRERERVRIQLMGDGSVAQVIADAHGDGRVRACIVHRDEAQPDASPAPVPEVDGRPSTAAVIGRSGQVVVTRDLGMARPYQGSVDLRSGEVDEDLEHYLDHSEQLPTVLRAEVVLGSDGRVLRAAGVLVQSFPGSPPELLLPPHARLAGDSLRTLLAAHDREPEQLVGLALGGEAFRTMLENPVRFHCPCGPERALSVLATLGAADLESLADEREQTEVGCNFCGQTTLVSAPQLRALAQRLRSGQS